MFSPRARGRIIGVLTAIVIIFFGLGKAEVIELHKIGSLLERTQPEMYRVVRVVDGDTIAVARSGQVERVRLIGVDTPETHHPDTPRQCYGPEATRFTKHLIRDEVRLVADPLGDNRDIYERLLRYVYTPEGSHVNAEIIRNGYGFAYRHFPFEQKQRFISLEQTARANDRGLWSNCPVIENDRGTLQTQPQPD